MKIILIRNLLICSSFFLSSEVSCGKIVINSLEEHGVKINISSSLAEDAYLTTNQLLVKYKYPSETHFVTTEYDYILRMHRITREGETPFVLMHGLLDTSATYILTAQKIALGYYLWDQEYGVWMGNARGNRYSRNHTILNPNEKEFWNLSFHEIGIYDVPAMIDYILNVTGYERLFYAGHSQGTTIFFIMCSKRPEYNKKVILMHALAPVAFTEFAKIPFKAAAPLLNTFEFFDIFYEFFPHNNFLRNICYDKKRNEITKFCVDLVKELIGPEKDLDWAIIPIILGHYPAGISIRQIQHFSQIHFSKRFQEFDYGAEQNFITYGQTCPFEYLLSKVTAPVALYFSEYDSRADRKDLDNIAKRLHNVVRIFRICQWTHLDFLWGKSARKVLYKIIANLSKSVV